MGSKIIYKDEESILTDEFIDVGYMAENFEVKDLNGEDFEIKRSANRNLQILMSFPSFDEFKDEILEFDTLMDEAQIDLFTYIIFNEKKDFDYKFKKLIPVFDEENEFGDIYGTKIVSGALEDKLTKALFLIGKDGAIYHIDMPENLDKPLNIENIKTALNKAYQSYTGVGCHG